MRATWVLSGLALLSVGCAAVLSIPDDSLSFCNQSGNAGHAYCEDFDVGDPSTRWSFVEALSGSTETLAPSDDSPPNLIDLTTPPVPAGGSALAGFTREFDDAGFTGLHIEADVRFVTGEAGITTQNGGFLLVANKSGGCIGIGVGSGGPGGRPTLGAVTFAQAGACSALVGGVAAADAGPPTNIPLMPAPPPNSWFHVIVDVKPDLVELDGRGTMTFDVRGLPSGAPPVPLGPMFLPKDGIPLVGFASEVNDQSDGLEVQFDNITVDLTSGS